MNHILGPLCCLLRVHSKYSNRAVTLIQQSRISNTLIEQSPHIAYAITSLEQFIVKLTNFYMHTHTHT